MFCEHQFTSGSYADRESEVKQKHNKKKIDRKYGHLAYSMTFCSTYGGIAVIVMSRTRSGQFS